MSATAANELAFAGPGAVAGLVHSKQVHARELVELCLRRIEALDPHLNAFRVTMPDEALAAADAAQGSRGPLAGVPFAVKDDVPVAGQAVTLGCRSHGPAARADAELVRRLRAAGAIPIGITNVPELAIWPWTASEAGGVTRNPWHPSRTPGGSSGGSAAAVAAGLVPFATGSDGGGSIRIPAGCCGLVGMKPTRGVLGGDPPAPAWLGLVVYGALARTVRDSALLLDVLHGDIDDGAQPPRSYRAAAAVEPGRLRIAISRKPPPGLVARLHTDQREAWERTAALLSELGHEVSERDPAYGAAQIEFLQTWVRGIYEQARVVPDGSVLEPRTRQMARAGRYLVPPRRRAMLLAKRPRTTARILALWNDTDVLLTPGLARTPILAQGPAGRTAPVAIDRAGRFTPYTPVFNLTGQPAVALPAGFDSDGLPLSVQLIGRPGAERTLYALAGQLEAARPWAQNQPPLS